MIASRQLVPTLTLWVAWYEHCPTAVRRLAHLSQSKATENDELAGLLLWLVRVPFVIRKKSATLLSSKRFSSPLRFIFFEKSAFPALPCCPASNTVEIP